MTSLIDLRVELKADTALDFLGIVAAQIPFATSRAINTTLDDAQKAIREHVHSSFTLRRPDFIDKTVYIGSADRAKKDRLEGTVRINPDRDFLAKFEDQTSKVARGAGNLAVPVFRQDSPEGIIPRGSPLSIRNLMAGIEKRGGKFKRLKGQKQRDVQRSAYIVHSLKGTFVIGRLGGETRVLYAFKHSVPIEPVLNFKEIAMRTALESWPVRAAEAIDFAIQTAR